MSRWSVFEYQYRDGGNYKAWGSVLLEGDASSVDVNALQERLESGEFFIAEQVGVPAVYRDLWEFSGGPTEDDHVWHEFREIRAATPEEVGGKPWGTVAELVSRFKKVQVWSEELSPHWDLPTRSDYWR